MKDIHGRPCMRLEYGNYLYFINTTKEPIVIGDVVIIENEINQNRPKPFRYPEVDNEDIFFFKLGTVSDIIQVDNRDHTEIIQFIIEMDRLYLYNEERKCLMNPYLFLKLPVLPFEISNEEIQQRLKDGTWGHEITMPNKLKVIL